MRICYYRMVSNSIAAPKLSTFLDINLLFLQSRMFTQAPVCLNKTKTMSSGLMKNSRLSWWLDSVRYFFVQGYQERNLLGWRVVILSAARLENKPHGTPGMGQHGKGYCILWLYHSYALSFLNSTELSMYCWQSLSLILRTHKHLFKAERSQRITWMVSSVAHRSTKPWVDCSFGTFIGIISYFYPLCLINQT